MKLLIILDFTYLPHTVIGSVAFIGGIVALSSKKGANLHKIGGKVFFFGMLYAALSIVKFMVDELRPLAILLSVATIYFLVTSICALRYKKKYSKRLDSFFIILPILMCTFACMQFVRILPEISLGTLARLLFSLTFALMVFRDIKRIKNNPKDHMFYLKRHAFRMILAFGFAVMAVLRIGVKLDFVDLEFSVVVPMLLALTGAFYAERNIEKLL